MGKFNILNFRHVSEGFKLAIEHHLDQPLMSMNELDISPGFETQVAVTPTLFTTSNAAKNRFTPDQRGCYMDHELSLTYLPNQVYRYGINNCLFEAAYEKGAQKICVNVSEYCIYLGIEIITNRHEILLD